MTAVTGLVLAGGSSMRMGTDKAVLVVDGQRLVDRAVRTLQACCEVVVVASGGRLIDGVDVAQVPDTVPAVGPLGGMLAGMAVAETPLVAVLAVDMPDASARVFSELVARWTTEPAIVPVVNGRLQPLHAVWSVDTASAIRNLVAQGVRSVAAVVDAVGAQRVELDGRFARNLNRPEDLGPEDAGDGDVVGGDAGAWDREA